MIPVTAELKAYLIAQRIVDLIEEAIPKPLSQETREELCLTEKILAGIIRKQLEYFEQIERELASGEEIGV